MTAAEMKEASSMLWNAIDELTKLEIFLCNMGQTSEAVFTIGAPAGVPVAATGTLPLAAPKSAPAVTPAPPLAENIAPKPLFARPPRKMAGM